MPLSDARLKCILKIIGSLQRADSPLEKLDDLILVVSIIYKSIVTRSSTIRNDEKNNSDNLLLPLMIWILAQAKFVDSEIESEFIWGLVHPSLFNGEGGYYLTTLSSAVQILKGLNKETTNNCAVNNSSSINSSNSSNSDTTTTTTSSSSNSSTLSKTINKSDCCSSVLRVLVPNELHGSIETQTLPIRMNMNTRDICRILAHKIKCTNPQDYGLYKLAQGEGNHSI